MDSEQAKTTHQDWLRQRRETFDIDLGHNHLLRYFSIDGKERVGAHVMHFRADGSLCEAAIEFYGPKAWSVGSWEPLTVTPSLLCHCGDHGWITGGKWVPA